MGFVDELAFVNRGGVDGGVAISVLDLGVGVLVVVCRYLCCS